MKKNRSNAPSKNTKILSFSNRRGRPKLNRPLFDTGTPETVMKRLAGITTEALDLCLEKEIINQKQHWCGIHLRWLYTLRYGVPSVKAASLNYAERFTTKTMNLEDPQWRSARESEYSNAVSILTQNGYSLLLINLCIYNELPAFFTFEHKKSANSAEITEKIREALNILIKLWKK